nr:MAG TPA: restriction alleviation protein [Caudoviricetes sp.]
MSEELGPCPFCGSGHVGLARVVRSRPSAKGLTAYEDDPRGGSHEVAVRDLKCLFSVRCRSCHARGPVASTGWRVVTERESLEWTWGSRYDLLAPDSDFARPAMEEAARKWNAIKEAGS